MHCSIAFAAVAAVIPLVSAHGSALPNMVGLNPRDLRARDLLSGLGARFTEVHELTKSPKNQLKARQDDRQCGEGVGSCAAGECCSGAGYCGTEPDYCYSPGCDYEHGSGCPENQTPGGSDTSSIPRTKVGNVQYGGAGIYGCKTPGTVAITYDDGPQKVFTSHVLDVMKSYNAHATFFITGNNINKGEIDTTQEFSDVIKRMDAEGHQIASHTWTHLDLSAVSSADRKAQMIKNEMALRNIVGKIPTYMRPPYSSCTAESGCEQDMADLGYHVTYFDLDTDDYEHDSPSLIQTSKDYFTGNVTSGSSANSQWLEIGHDIHEQTAMNLTEYMLSTLTQLGYRAVTVGDCLGDPKANWYRTAGGAGAAPSSTRTSATGTPTGTKKVSTDGKCGGSTTCLSSEFGNCCSAAGWCGMSTDHCGTGCQSGFGNCGSNGQTTTRPATTTTTRAATPTAAPSAGGKVSTDGSCGGASGFTCAGSEFGNCCSQYGWCGSMTDHCSTGCNAAFGTCSGAGTTTTKPAPTKKASTDGSCAGTSGFTCSGAAFGQCCSQYGYCGDTTGHCGSGCQNGFGTCS